LKRGRHRPVRTCLGCGARDSQDRMLRLAVGASGELRLQERGGGRGGYLHRRNRCWEACLGKKRFYRAFRVEVGREARVKMVQELRRGCLEYADD